MASSKSDRLFQKLNRSLGAEDDTPATAPQEQPAPPAKPKRKRTTAKTATAPRKRTSPRKRTAPPLTAPTPTATTPPAVEPPPAPAPATPAPRRLAAEKCVLQHVPFAVGAGLIPLPLADLAAIGGLQLKVLRDLAHLYELPFTKAQGEAIVTSLLGSVGGTALTWGLLSSVAKVLPVVGTWFSATTLPAAAGTITYAIGQLAIDHFEQGGTLENFDLDVAQAAMARKIQEAKTKLAAAKQPD